MDTKMTTFKIPEGKVVDRIEFEDGEGKATINIIYKEDAPKIKDTMVLVETEADTWIYRNKLTGNLVHIVGGPKNQENYIPLRQAEAGEFVVLPAEILDELLVEIASEINEVCDTPSASFAHGEAVMAVRRHWQILHTLLSERK